MLDLAFVLAGFVVGLIVGLTGVGGGSLMTPILIFFFGVKPYLAVGTDLLFAAFTKMGGTVKLARSGRVDWRVVAQPVGGQHPACADHACTCCTTLGASQPGGATAR
ncbi:MAG: sulfite exporter TauE/SafE family protein [Rhodoferax sp.]|nr:sulfite exporter TauE/SafE family protein [Rhodoferax sp.]